MAEETSKELSLEDIAQAEDLVIERVDVPEWGGHVYVRNMPGTIRDKYLKSIRRIVTKGKTQRVEVELDDAGAKLLTYTLCDKHGNLKANAGHVTMLAGKSAVALQRCIDAAGRINGLNDESEEDAKNSSPAQTGTESDSSSVSPVS
jgi:hypothetical protein